MFSSETCTFWRHQLISEHLCCTVLKSAWNTSFFTHLSDRLVLSRVCFMRAVWSRWTCRRCQSGNSAAVLTAVHVYCCKLSTQLDLELQGMERCTPGRHRDVTSVAATHVTGSVFLGGKQLLLGYSRLTAALCFYPDTRRQHATFCVWLFAQLLRIFITYNREYLAETLIC